MVWVMYLRGCGKFLRVLFEDVNDVSRSHLFNRIHVCFRRIRACARTRIPSLVFGVDGLIIIEGAVCLIGDCGL